MRRAMKDFTGKRFYITGGSSGIGLAVARTLSALGAHIAIFARNMAGLESARKTIERDRRSTDQKIDIMQTDVSDHGDVTQKMKQAVAEFGAPDIVITSAGVGNADYFENISHEAFDALMKINVYGTRSVIAALLEDLKKRGGQIVIIASVAGFMGMFGYTSYATSKFALVGFAECLRAELKPQGVSVTLVCPPEVDTPFLKNEDTIPPEGRAIKNMAGTLTVQPVAEAIVRGISRKRFLVIPGRYIRFLFFNHRLTNGWATRFTSDLVIKWVRRRR